MARVFVSHASEDHLVAAQLHQWLVDDGHDVFLDQDLRDGIALGEEWEQRLYERLRWADAVVCLITASYNIERGRSAHRRSSCSKARRAVETPGARPPPVGGDIDAMMDCGQLPSAVQRRRAGLRSVSQ